VSAHNVRSQLNRDLLRARALCGEDELPVTQELVGESLGVRRTSVTKGAKSLRASGLIAYKRGRIEIINLSELKGRPANATVR
jgi:CRP-like cAMP-binding protein